MVGLYAQRGQPFLLLGQQPRPGGQLPVGVDQVGQDAVVPLPAQGPEAVPGQLALEFAGGGEGPERQNA
ncbi:hypothetical protein [Streptomyces sp. NPDC093225]|uniref:hypothetical protein n=1 Tax=Streptomyces sp. NPDC093225 TaxID=3366034 RepID=UPI003801FF6D